MVWVIFVIVVALGYLGEFGSKLGNSSFTCWFARCDWKLALPDDRRG